MEGHSSGGLDEASQPLVHSARLKPARSAPSFRPATRTSIQAAPTPNRFRRARSPPLGLHSFGSQPRGLGSPLGNAVEAALCGFFGGRSPQNAGFSSLQVICRDLVHLGVGTPRGFHEAIAFRSWTSTAASPHRGHSSRAPFTSARPRVGRWCWWHESPTSAIPSAVDIGLSLSRRGARRRGPAAGSPSPTPPRTGGRRLLAPGRARAGPLGGTAGGYRVERRRPCGRV